MVILLSSRDAGGISTAPVAGDGVPQHESAAVDEVEENGAAVAEAEEGRLTVAGAEAAEEAVVGDEAAPALADEGGAREGGRLRREAEEDLGEEVVVVQRRRRRGGALAAAVHHRRVGVFLFVCLFSFFFELQNTGAVYSLYQLLYATSVVYGLKRYGNGRKSSLSFSFSYFFRNRNRNWKPGYENGIEYYRNRKRSENEPARIR
uniref:Uncharacterized protein n=1 Tax=Oryza rufipogon TaxID=4529 RepID=A0A0E0QW31_ORYRU